MQYVVLTLRYTDEQCIPSIVDLLIRQIWSVRMLPDAISECGRANLSPIKSIEKVVLGLMSEEFRYIFDTQCSKSLTHTTEVYRENYIAIIKDNIFNFLHVKFCFVSANIDNCIVKKELNLAKLTTAPIAQSVRVEDS